MVQAYTLVALEWKPARWDDIGSLPDRVVRDYFAIRDGREAAREPFAWYRPTGQGVVLAHLFRVGPDGPEEVARCGVTTEGAAHERHDTPPLCQRCEAIATGKQTSIGTIGDLDVEEGRA